MKLFYTFGSILPIIITLFGCTSSEEGWVNPTDNRIQYVGRTTTTKEGNVKWNYTGTTISTRFKGTAIEINCKPNSGYFMVSLDDNDIQKIAVLEHDSTITIAKGLGNTEHDISLMYCIEGHDNNPEFRGFRVSEGQLISPKPLPERKIEFIGNSITCAFGVEDENPNSPFDYATENHYYSFAAETARRLGAQHFATARSGIGIYRHYGSSSEGSEFCMPNQYENTLLYDNSEKWDFDKYQPQVICVNLGTNDTSPDLESPIIGDQNYDVNVKREIGCKPEKLYAAYKAFIVTLRNHYPKAKIVMTCGSMLNGDALKLISETLDSVVAEANNEGDKEIFRFNFTPQDGSLGYAACWHPSRAQHMKMADELTPFLSELMDW